MAATSDMEDMSWADVENIVTALKRVYDNAEDVKVVSTLKELYGEVQTLFAQHETDARDAIRALTTRVAAAKTRSERKEPSEAFLKRLAEMNAEKAELTASIEALSNDKAVTEASVAEVREQALAYAEKLNDLEATASEDIPRVKYSISLYANITNIRWDFESDKVAGYIAPSNSAAKAFEIDPSTSSDYETANALWELMG